MAQLFRTLGAALRAAQVNSAFAPSCRERGVVQGRCAWQGSVACWYLRFRAALSTVTVTKGSMASFTLSMRATIAAIQDTTINCPLWHDRVSLVFGAYACPSTMLPLAREGLAAGARHMQLQGAGQENVPPVRGGKVRSIGAAPAQRSCMAAVGKCCAGSHIQEQGVSSG